MSAPITNEIHQLTNGQQTHITHTQHTHTTHTPQTEDKRRHKINLSQKRLSAAFGLLALGSGPTCRLPASLPASILLLSEFPPPLSRSPSTVRPPSKACNISLDITSTESEGVAMSTPSCDCPPLCKSVFCK